MDSDPDPETAMSRIPFPRLTARRLGLLLVVILATVAVPGSVGDAGASPDEADVSELQIAAVAPDWVVLTWNSASEAGARVTFTGSGRVVESPLTGLRHRIDLTGLECATDYDLEVGSPPVPGSAATPVLLRVTTAVCPTADSPWRVDPNRPIPLPAPEITEPTARATGSDTVEIGWMTDRFSGAVVELTDPSGEMSSFPSPPGSGPMAVSVEGLECDTDYQVAIRASGPTGAEGAADTEVTTGPCPSPEPVDISISPGLGSLDIAWRTSVPTLAQVSWGSDPLADSLVAVTEPGEDHLVTIEGLECGTTYWVRVAAIDAEGSRIGWSPEIVATTVDCVEDTGGPDTPVLNLVGVGTRVGFDQVDIAWTTDVMSLAVVEIGPVGAEPDLVLESGPAVDHSVTAEGLECDTTYAYRILARAEGSPGTPAPPDAVETGEFTTSGCEAVETTIDALTVEAQRDRAVLVFDTPVPTTAFVQWGTTDLYDFAVEASELVTHHEISLEGLRCGTLYHFDIEVLDAGPDMPAITGDLTFTTLACEDQGVPDPGAVPALS